MQQRYYDPQMGRFLSSDPVASDGRGKNFNRYWYGNNSPLTVVDPDGRTGAYYLFRLIAPLFLPPPRPISAPPSQPSTIDDTPSARDPSGGRPARPAGREPWEGRQPRGEGRDHTHRNESGEGNNNPYEGPVSEPVTVVDGDGNAIPVAAGEQIGASPNGRFQQVIGSNGQPTGTRMDKDGHPKQKDPKAQEPHGHRPGVTDDSGNPHLPLNPPAT